MARTTLDLDTAVLQDLKARRDSEGRPMGVIASELLAQALNADTPLRRPFAWNVNALGAKVDLDDKDAIWAVLDRP